MPIPRWILFLAGLVTASFAPLSATWLQVGGPVQPVIELRLDPSQPQLLYAQILAVGGDASYLWRSEDAGATWRDVQVGLQRPFSALAIDPEDPQVLWAWTRTNELWRSADAGTTWEQRPTSSPPTTPRIIQLLVDPRRPETLYRVDVDSSRPLVAVSRDGGATFTKGPFLSKTFTNPEPVLAPPDRDELLAFVAEGLLVSTDGGQSWHLRGQFRHAGFVSGALAPSAPATLYGVAANPNQCLARSDDDGAHWQSLAYPPRLPAAHATCIAVAVDPLNARHLWVAAQVAETRYLLFESRNGGASWSNPMTEPVPGVVAAGGERIYTSSGPTPGLYVSSNGGRSWTATDRGIIAGDLRDGLVAQRLPGGGGGRRVVALNTPLNEDPDFLYRSDGGLDWVEIPLKPVTIADAGGSVVLAGDFHGISRSLDGGNTWSVVPSAPAGARGLRPSVTQPAYMALDMIDTTGPYDQITLWMSDDAGATWRRSGDTLSVECSPLAFYKCPNLPAYAVDPSNPSRRWAAYNYPADFESPAIFTSQDGGASWQVATSSLPQALALAADPTTPGRILTGTYGGLFVSEDSGTSWQPLGDLPDFAVSQLIRDPLSATWYAATLANGIFRSLDNGAHWTPLDGAPDLDAPTIAVDPRRPTALLAAFAGQGLWRWVP